MYFSDKELISKKNIIEFTLPRLHKGKQWYVDFFAYDPTIDGLRRKKYMLDHYKLQKEREDIAAILIHNIFEKLKAGWNPFVNATKTRQFTDFGIVLKRYSEYLEIAEKKGILKNKTATDYRSRLKQLSVYLSETDVEIKYVYQFDRTFAVDFLDYLIFDKDVSPKTRNNYRAWLSTLATWMHERQYIENNPIETIHMTRETEKFRNPMPPDALARIRAYTLKYNPPFYLACMMEYYTFIRPDELRYIRVGDIDIVNQTIFVSSEISKNRKGQTVAINDTLIKTMIEQKVFDHFSNEYLFGRNFTPGKEQIYINRFRVEWKKMRDKLRFPDSYQFYSLKDSGIRDLANAKGIVIARDQARHTDISVTNKYLKNQNIAHEEIKHYEGNL